VVKDSTEEMTGQKAESTLKERCEHHNLIHIGSGALEQWNLEVEPHSCSSRGPLVLDGEHQFCSMTSVMFRMEVDASILC
jgi:hypothetical protein